MERSTGRDENGNLLFRGEQVYAGELYDAVDKLEYYEDTGYTPEEIEALKADCAVMWEAMEEFCARTEKGEIRSRRTYAKFMEILHATIQYKALNQHK